ncbi:unnamed protein product [Cunninghamella blakesleeana]
MMNNPSKNKPYDEDSGDDSNEKPSKRSGRRKIKIEYIEDKNRRHITFSKRKAGIMKKAYELSTLTGTQVLLLVVSETGLVYTFTTVKLQPIVTKPEGKNLIQACLNAPDPMNESENQNNNEGNSPSSHPIEEKSEPMSTSSSGYTNNTNPNTAPTYPPNYPPAGQNPGMSGNGYPSYSGYQQPHPSQPQSSPGQPPYGGGMPYYQQQQQQQHYMPPNRQGYWSKDDDVHDK